MTDLSLSAEAPEQSSYSQSDVDDILARMHQLQFDEGRHLFAVQYLNVHKAAMDGSVAGIKYFLSKGVDIDLRDRQQRTALHFAAIRGHALVAQELIDHRCVINVCNQAGMQPIHLAAKNGHVKVVQLLVANGANLLAVNNMRNTCVHLAAAENRRDVLELIWEHVNDDEARQDNLQQIMSCKGFNSMEPLHLAAQSAAGDCCRFLVDVGADPNATDAMGDTPLHKAARIGSVECYKLLKSAGANEILMNEHEQTAKALLVDEVLPR